MMSGCIWTVLYYFALIIGAVLVGFRIYIKTLAKRCDSFVCLVGKTIIVTGANTGIGYYAALDFAKRGAKVILACRNEGKAKEAVDTIISETGNPKVIYKVVDFKSFDSIRAFCKNINETEEKIDVLVNNAGAGGLKDVNTADGFNVSWQTNYFGPYLLTVLLLDKLKQSSPSRIVNVSSLMAKYCALDVQALNRLNAPKVYSWTKLANILFSRELARRLNGTQVSVYALHPGAIYTDIWRHMPKWFIATCVPIMKFIYKTAEEGSQTTIYCSIAKECENHSGRLYQECGEIEMYDSAKDMQLAKDIFEKTAELVKLEAHERSNISS